MCIRDRGDGDGLQATRRLAEYDGGVSGRSDLECCPASEVRAVFEDLCAFVYGLLAASEGKDEVRARGIEPGQDGGIDCARVSAENVFEKVCDAVAVRISTDGSIS